MCGIAGQVARNDKPLYDVAANMERMRDALKHRGPDQDGIYISAGGGADLSRTSEGSSAQGKFSIGKLAFCHTRLAVIDVENGRQPMHFQTRCEHLVLVYNGELYNTDELRKELISRGHKFRTRSDTEVVGAAYIQWGSACVERLNGIFAFAVWEENAQRLFLARDRIGVKPLFYVLRDDTLIFASEIPALLAHSEIDAELDENGIAELIFLAPGRTPGCGVLRGIAELEAGHFAELARDGFRVRKYWDLVDAECSDTFEQAVEKTRFLVRDAIERQLVSDVPIATFLSGGLDSSIISSIAYAHLAERGETLRTFSVGYRDNAKFFKAGKFQPNSDEAFIARMNEFLPNSQHFDVTLDTAQLVPALYEATEARGLPGMADVDASLLLFCREIKKHATVALSGECADEIFGGYPWFRDPEIRAIDGFPWAQSTAWRQSFLGAAYNIDGAAYVDERYRKTLAETLVVAANESERRVKEMVNLNFKWFMQTLLDRKDRMSMYSGLEVRVPFCDYRIAEYVYSLPWVFKDYNNTEKGLLRHAMRDILPDEVLWRKKSPYPKTHNPNYLAAVSAELRAVLENPASPLLQIVKRDALTDLLSAEVGTSGSLRSNEPWYGQLMTVPQTIAYFLQLNHWLAVCRVRLV